MSNRVIWTEAEIQILAEKSADRLLKLSGKSPKDFSEFSTTELFKAICIAQKSLPVERQRPLKSHFNVAHCFPVVETAYYGRMKILLDEINDTVKVTPEPKEANLSKLFEGLIDSMVDRIVARVTANILEKLSQPVAPTVVQHVKEKVIREATLKPHKILSIGIIGLIGAQRTIISKKYDDVDFRFFDRRFPKHPPKVEYMIGVTNFMSHSTEETAISHFGDNFIRLTGGMSQLENKINQLRNK
jgi:hypothetical protein